MYRFSRHSDGSSLPRVLSSLTMKGRNAGFSLVLVLVLLVLSTVLIVGFLSTVSTETISSKAAASTAGTHQLADMAVQIVMGQIRQATTGADANSNTLAWASQPGMIRTYDTTGAPYAFYKLYSSSTMVVTNNLQSGLSSLLSGDVAPAQFTNGNQCIDLNAPVADATGTNQFPILDPMALTNGIQGFYTNAASPGYSGGTPSATNNSLSMPVQWLYVLQNGTLAAMSNGTIQTVTTTTTRSNGRPVTTTTTNPIIGRIAFWTDDETCKVNINTAAEGTYWDTPRIGYTTLTAGNISSYTTQQGSILQYPDYAFTAYQPAKFEFQRYPGHPAQVALSTVFTNVTPATATNITPRIVWGGSQAGTNYPSTAISLVNAPRYALYASVDEFLFSSTNTGGSRTPNTVAASALTKSQLEASKFFITTSSRAPEVTLFNTPRIACWPIDRSLAAGSANASNRTTAYDRLIAYCASTTNPNTGYLPYYFQRTNSQDPTNDFVNIPRNQALYSYLRALTSSNIPGFGGNFSSKYPSDRDQILTEIFDYIRCINLVDPNLPGYPLTNALNASPGGAKWPRTTNQFSQGVDVAWGRSSTFLLGLGQVMPIRITTNGATTAGFGRIGTIKELGLVAICMADGSMPTNALNFLTNFTNGSDPTSVDAQFASYSKAFLADSNCMLTDANGTNQIVAFISNMAKTGQLGISTNASDYTNYPGLSTCWVLTNPIINGTNYWNYVASLWTNTWIPKVTNTTAPSNDTNPVATTIFTFVTGFCSTNPSSSTIPANAWSTYCNPTLGGTSLAWNQKRVQLVFLPAIQNVQAGMINYGPDLLLGLSGLSTITIANAINIMGGGLLFPADQPTSSGPLLHVINTGSGRPYNNPLGTADLVHPTSRVGTNFHTSWRTNVLDFYPWNNSFTYPNPYYSWVSQPFTINTNTGANLQLSSFTVTNSLYQGLNCYDPNATNSPNGMSTYYVESTAPTFATVTNGAVTNLIQTATITFPSMNLPLPTLPPITSSSFGVWYYFLMEDRLLRANESPDGSASFNLGGEVTRSMNFNGDPRIAALMSNIPSSFFVPNSDYSSATLVASNQVPVTQPTGHIPPPYGTAIGSSVGTGLNCIGGPATTTLGGYIPSGTTVTTNGDFDMYCNGAPGGFINKPDEGDFRPPPAGIQAIPYYYWTPLTTNILAYTPNRIMPSPGMFGSLPTGVQKAISGKGTSPNAVGNWQTLLFRPQPTHPSAAIPATTTANNKYTTPPDHLIMDLFWMPIVEPYAISEAFSTDGKVNMNYQILPFTNIVRETALLAAMKNKMITAVPNGITSYAADAGTANYLTSANWTNSTCWRKTLNLSDSNGSLLQFQQKFAAGDIFRSATEICDIYLVPGGPAGQTWTDGWTGTQAAAFWANNLNTSDNLREKPYTDLYAHLTTKSNIYTVHFRVQTLKKSPSTSATTWVEGTDKVLGEYRGSCMIERYLDTGDTTLPDFAANPGANNINNFYKFRVISTKKFAP